MNTLVSLYPRHWYWLGNSSAGRAAHGVTAALPAAWVVWGCYKGVAIGGWVELRRHWGRPWAPGENEWE